MVPVIELLAGTHAPGDGLRRAFSGELYGMCEDWVIDRSWEMAGYWLGRRAGVRVA